MNLLCDIANLTKGVTGKTRTRDKYRVVYSDHQRVELEKEFYLSRYITIRRKSELASSLALSERQVKIWFQNRRAKERKQNKKKEDAKTKDPNGQHHHSTSASTGGQVPGGQTPHHTILGKEGLITCSNGSIANVQTGGLSGMVSPSYGTVLSTVPNTAALMSESGLKMVGTASPSTASSPSSPSYTHVIHHHHQLNHHHATLPHNPHHTGHLLNYADTAHCNHY